MILYPRRVIETKRDTNQDRILAEYTSNTTIPTPSSSKKPTYLSPSNQQTSHDRDLEQQHDLHTSKNHTRVSLAPPLDRTEMWKKKDSRRLCLAFCVRGECVIRMVEFAINVTVFSTFNCLWWYSVKSKKNIWNVYEMFDRDWGDPNMVTIVILGVIRAEYHDDW